MAGPYPPYCSPETDAVTFKTSPMGGIRSPDPSDWEAMRPVMISLHENGVSPVNVLHRFPTWQMTEAQIKQKLKEWSYKRGEETERSFLLIPAPERKSRKKRSNDLWIFDPPISAQTEYSAISDLTNDSGVSDLTNDSGISDLTNDSSYATLNSIDKGFDIFTNAKERKHGTISSPTRDSTYGIMDVLEILGGKEDFLSGIDAPEANVECGGNIIPLQVRKLHSLGQDDVTCHQNMAEPPPSDNDGHQANADPLLNSESERGLLRSAFDSSPSQRPGSALKGCLRYDTLKVKAEDSEEDESSPEDSLYSLSNGSDISVDYECSDPHLFAIRGRVRQALLDAFDSRKTGFRSCAANENENETRHGGLDSSAKLKNSTITNSNGKRSMEGRDDESQEDERNGKKRRIRSPSSQVVELRLLACPFYKYDRRRHRKCSTCVLREISRLKQHLERNHLVPLHCASCFQLFESEEERDKHTRQRTCLVLSPRTFEGINETQRRQLKKRCSASKSREENWYLIYDILFPESRIRPDNPYLEETLSADLLAFYDFCSAEGPSIYNPIISSELSEAMRYQEPEIQRIVHAVFQDGLQTILERWEARQSPARSNGSLSSQTTSVPLLATLLETPPPRDGQATLEMSILPSASGLDSAANRSLPSPPESNGPQPAGGIELNRTSSVSRVLNFHEMRPSTVGPAPTEADFSDPSTTDGIDWPPASDELSSGIDNGAVGITGVITLFQLDAVMLSRIFVD